MAKNKNKRGVSGRHKNWTDEIPHPADEVKAPIASPVSVSTVAPLLLTVAEVGSLLNVSRMTVHRLEKSGELPGRVKLGGQVRYHREKIEKWLLERCDDSGEENHGSP